MARKWWQEGWPLKANWGGWVRIWFGEAKSWWGKPRDNVGISHPLVVNAAVRLPQGGVPPSAPPSQMIRVGFGFSSDSSQRRKRVLKTAVRELQLKILETDLLSKSLEAQGSFLSYFLLLYPSLRLLRWVQVLGRDGSN
jgi:hypothetical protein